MLSVYYDTLISGKQFHRIKALRIKGAIENAKAAIPLLQQGLALHVVERDCAARDDQRAEHRDIAERDVGGVAEALADIKVARNGRILQDAGRADGRARRIGAL